MLSSWHTTLRPAASGETENTLRHGPRLPVFLRLVFFLVDLSTSPVSESKLDLEKERTPLATCQFFAEVDEVLSFLLQSKLLAFFWKNRYSELLLRLVSNNFGAELTRHVNVARPEVKMKNAGILSNQRKGCCRMDGRLGQRMPGHLWDPRWRHRRDL